MGNYFFLNNKDKDDFAQEYHQAEGFVLDRACRANNSVQNDPATLVLNSTRGRKCAQNEKKTHTTQVTVQCEHQGYKLNMRNEPPGNIPSITTTGRNTATVKLYPEHLDVLMIRTLVLGIENVCE
jgi:hypothetical protein